MQVRRDCVRDEVEVRGAVTGRSAADFGCCGGVLDCELHGAGHDVDSSLPNVCQVHAVLKCERHGWGHDVEVGYADVRHVYPVRSAILYAYLISSKLCSLLKVKSRKYRRCRSKGNAQEKCSTKVYDDGQLI